MSCDGRCCRKYNVHVTGWDVSRIMELGFDPLEFVSFLPVGAEGSVFPDVRIVDGYYYMILSRERDGSCIFSEESGGGLKCGIHGHHPMVCRLYPFDGEGRARSKRLCQVAGEAAAEHKMIYANTVREIKSYCEKARNWNKSPGISRTRKDFIDYVLSP